MRIWRNYLICLYWILNWALRCKCMLLIYYFFSFLLVSIPNCIFTVWICLVLRNIWISNASLLLDWWGALDYLFFNYWLNFHNFWFINSLFFYWRFCNIFLFLNWFFNWFRNNFLCWLFLSNFFNWCRFFSNYFFNWCRFFSNNFFMDYFFLSWLFNNCFFRDWFFDDFFLCNILL